MWLMPEEKKEPLVRKILKLYENYGLDISDMDEDELNRLVELYKSGVSNIDKDLKKSSKHAGKFENDIL